MRGRHVHRPRGRHLAPVRPAALLGRCALAVVGGYAAVAVAVTAGAAACGWTTSVVVSGSMGPALHAGDVVVAAPRSAAQLRAGDVVVHESAPGSSTALRTHRLVARGADGTWTTRGDANPTPDSDAVDPAQVRGVVVLVLPRAGAPLLLLPEAWLR